LYQCFSNLFCHIFRCAHLAANEDVYHDMSLVIKMFGYTTGIKSTSATVLV
jgi:hypothetical protein